MNILFIVKDMEYGNGGVCTHILALASKYIQSGHNVWLIADGSDYTKEIEDIGITFIQTISMKSVSKNIFVFIDAYKEIRKLCKANRIDIIHLHTQSAIPVAALLKKNHGIPYLWTNHIDDIPSPNILKTFFKLFKFPIISVSQDLKDDLINRFAVDPKKISVIPNGIILNDFKPLTSEEKRNVLNRYDINPNEFNITILSRIAYNKGHDILMKAIKIAKEKNKKFHCNVILAGTIEDREWYKNDVIDFATKNKIEIKYIGFGIPREIFGIGDLFVLPSRKEGFGMVCIEAMVMNCPVIRSKSPGWSSMIEYCDVVEIEDYESLSDKILDFFADESSLKNKTKLGYKAVKTRFNSECMAETTLEIYKRIIQGDIL